MMIIALWIYTVITILVFAGLLIARNSSKVKFEYDDFRIQSFVHLYGEIMLFGLIALFWPLLIIGTNVKIRKD